MLCDPLPEGVTTWQAALTKVLPAVKSSKMKNSKTKSFLWICLERTSTPPGDSSLLIMVRAENPLNQQESMALVENAQPVGKTFEGQVHSPVLRLLLPPAANALCACLKNL